MYKMNFTRILTQALFKEVQHGNKQNPLKGKEMSRLCYIQGINDYLERENSC